MEVQNGFVARLSHFVHHYFLALLAGSYLLAGFLPAPGLWLRGLSFGEFVLLGERTTLSLPAALLSLLLFNAGLGMRLARLRGLARNPLILLAGLAANLAVPILFILGVSQTMRLWHNPDEVQDILVGLALVASMPVAGSSTAWSQNANGDLALSLGLVVFSTLLSPLTTPLALHSVGWMAHGTYAEALHHLAAGGVGVFLTLFVLLPILGGVGLCGLVGAERVGRARPGLKLANSANLLLLSYSNAAAALPQVVAEPDWDFLGVMLAIVVGMCMLGFASGWVVAQAFRADRPRRTAMMFGLGMNNNGTGLVLAATALSALPQVMLPVIFYNLVQHLVAGAADYMTGRDPEAPTPQAERAPAPLRQAG